MHGMYAYDAPDPVAYVKKIRNFTLKGIGDKITFFPIIFKQG